MDGRRLIDADEFVEWLLADAITDEQREFAEKVRYAAERMKPADAVPVVHGHWNGGADDASCSVCGRNLLDFFSYTEYCGVYEYPKFCPNCAARMDGNGNGNETD